MATHRFSLDWKALADRAKADVDIVVRKATLDMFKAIVERSPVDTGRFRANWNCSQGSPNNATSGDTDQARGFAEAQKALGYAAGGIVYFVNALPYGTRLEYEGWSSQAPSGMVRITIAEFDQYVKKAITT